MIVKFDQDDVEFVRDWATRLDAYKRQNNIKDKNFFIDKCSETTAMGLFGELACARYFDVETNLDFTKGGDDGNDLKAWGLKWQIKTSSIRKLIFNSLDEFTSDAAILVHLISSKKQMFELPHFHVLGGISQKRFIKQHYTHDFGYGMRAVCDLDQLTGLNTIKEKCKA